MLDDIIQNDCQGEWPEPCRICDGTGFRRTELGSSAFQICECVDINEDPEEEIRMAGFKAGFQDAELCFAAEIARLQAELNEAREIINDVISFPFSAEVRARAFLKGETDA